MSSTDAISSRQYQMNTVKQSLIYLLLTHFNPDYGTVQIEHTKRSISSQRADQQFNKSSGQSQGHCVEDGWCGGHGVTKMRSLLTSQALRPCGCLSCLLSRAWTAVISEGLDMNTHQSY